MKKSSLRLICLVCAWLLVFLTFPLGIFAANADYAEIKFGTSESYTNASMATYGSSIVKTAQRDGRTGRISDKNTGQYYLYINITDSLFHDLPMYTPIDVTVEYYDSEGGWFNIAYDSLNPQQYQNLADNAQIWRSSELVYLTGTNTWKSHTFHFEDMKMGNRANNCDLRVEVYDAFQRASPADVVFGSVTVKKSELTTPLNINGVSSEHLGNIFSADQELVLNPVFENKGESDISVSFDYKITAADGTQVASGSGEPVELTSRESKNGEIRIDNPKIYGLYKVDIEAKTTDSAHPGKIYEDAESDSFSVSTIIADGEQDPSYGACQQIVGYNRGDPYDTTELMSEMGMSLVRDEYKWADVEKKKGVLNLDPAITEKLKTMHDNGIDVLLIMSGYHNDYDNGDTPHSDEGIAAFARYCGYMAGELKGIVNKFEVWNEWNINAFNKSNESPETYAKLLKACYIAIKEANPDAVVLSTGTAQIVLDWFERMFDAGGYEYFDVLATHPYDWSGSFREQKLLQDTADLKALMQKYGPLKPIWFTEIGFSSYTKGYTREEQASKQLMLKSLCKAYDLCEKLYIYCYYDRQNPDYSEANWGFVNMWSDSVNTPNGAKESFLEAAASDNLIGKNAQFKQKLEDDRTYAMDFYNSNMDRDVMVLLSGEGTKIKNYNLGCSSVTLYDMYGNQTDEIYSDSGIYSFCVSEVPYYVVGTFSEFELSETPGTVTADSVIEQVVSGDDVTFTFTADTQKEMTVNAEPAPQLTVKENTGFADGKASLTFNLSNSADTADDFYIKVTDTEGRVYYSQRTRLEVVDPLTISVTAERASQVSDSLWRLRVKAQSNSLNQTMAGTLQVTAPDEAVSQPRSFEELRPGETATFLFNLPEKMTKETMDVEILAEMAGGYKMTASEKLSFTTCVYAENKPTIDGVSAPGEWPGSWFGAQQKKDVYSVTGVNWQWGGPSDLSFSASTMWDEDKLYMLVIVNDNVFSVTHGNMDDPYYMYMGDGMQIGLDDRETINSVETASFTEIGVGHLPTLGDIVFRNKCLYGDRLEQRVEIEGAELVIKRYDTYTLYEMAIPWDGIFYDNYVLNPSGRMGFSMIVNDNDVDKRLGWIQYMDGIGMSKNATLFGDMTFTK